MEDIKKTTIDTYLDLSQTSTSHTLNLEHYLKYRLATTIREFANASRVIIWLGSQKEIQTYMQQHGIQQTGLIYAQNLRRFVLAKVCYGLQN